MSSKNTRSRGITLIPVARITSLSRHIDSLAAVDSVNPLAVPSGSRRFPDERGIATREKLSQERRLISFSLESGSRLIRDARRRRSVAGRRGNSVIRTLSSFWKYSRRKEIGFSGRPTHSCTIQSFRTCWILCR